jgi:hypothetical protein
VARCVVKSTLEYSSILCRTGVRWDWANSYCGPRNTSHRLVERLKGLPDRVYLTGSPDTSVANSRQLPGNNPGTDPVDSALSIKQQSREACRWNNPSDIDAKTE